MLIDSSARAPWTNVLGLARSLLATGLLLTLCATDGAVLFDRDQLAQMAVAGNPLLHLNLFVLLRDHIAIGHGLAIAILLVVASGWRPRWTAAAHWWVACSFGAACKMPDGGDHIHIVLSTLLLGAAITDPRRWHWDAAPDTRGAPLRRRIAAYAAASFLVVCALQMSVVYFHAAIGKMAVDEWVNGTATYYWFVDPAMGAPDWMLALLEPVLRTSGGALAFTWGTLVLELALCAGPLLAPRHRRWLLIAGLVFHAGILMVHGLVSFFFSMAAGLVLLLRRHHEPFALPAVVGRAVARVRRFQLVTARDGRAPSPRPLVEDPS